jgi:cytochrome c oxidase cbb3-type subunit 3/ubiquinol-cytochrome c reductase cytochrome c subunit
MISLNSPVPRFLALCLLACAATLPIAGCRNVPGKPGPEPEVTRPEQLADFATLYNQNCASCHGVNGKNAAAISLANPIYLAIAGVANIQRVTANGVPGTTMPPFSKVAGGMLTDRQITILAEGMERNWGSPDALAGQVAPAYASNAPGDPVQGQKTFAAFCARCHGVDGNGAPVGNGIVTGSLVDSAYLALISDQGLRSIIIAGQPEQGMPDWRSHLNGPGARPMTDQEITDVVAWLTSHRIATPGQVYKQHP